MEAEVHSVPEKLEEPRLIDPNSGFERERAEILQASRVMFEQMLTRWAGDWLRLLARQLDRPVTDGRVTTIQKRDQTLEISPRRSIQASNAHRRSTIDRIRRRQAG